jgi:hypothetical protein
VLAIVCDDDEQDTADDLLRHHIAVSDGMTKRERLAQLHMMFAFIS